MFSNFGTPVKIINLGRSKYYVQFDKLSQAIQAKKKLENMYIHDIKANISIKLCKEDPTLPATTKLPLDTYHCLFEIRVPIVKYFDHKAKILGIQDYNIDRVMELSNRDYFHGEVMVKYLAEEDLKYDERRLRSSSRQNNPVQTGQNQS